MIKFKQFLNIIFGSELSINSKFRSILGKTISFEVKFNNQETKEEFEEKISILNASHLNSESLASIFYVLIRSDLSRRYPEPTMSLLNNVNEKDIINIFSSIIKYDNLLMCETFLNHSDKKYKQILSLDVDYSYYLSLSVESGAKNITEYFLKNDKFSKLLSDSNFATEILSSCLSINNVEITNLLLSHDINLNNVKDEIANTINSGRTNIPEYYNSEVMKQVQKKLIHDNLLENLSETKPKHKKLKL